jgi:hypothetical protein
MRALNRALLFSHIFFHFFIDLFGLKRMNLHICTPNKNGPVVQLVRMPPCHGGGRGFESRPDRRNAKAETKKASRNVGLFCFQAVGKMNRLTKE